LYVVPMQDSLTRDEQDPDVEFRMWTFTAGVFNWATRGLRRLTDQNGFTRVEKGEADLREVRNDWQNHTIFLDECVQEAPLKTFTSSSDLNAKYQEWCRRGSYNRVQNDQALKQAVLQKFRQAKYTKRSLRGKQMRGYAGITL
ncbi:hypothetical protein LCGC14_2018320, partial [marine sediment metagenome]